MNETPSPRPTEQPDSRVQHLLADGTIVAERYRVEGILGQGGMGTVYVAEQLALRRSVALKVLSPELSRDVKFRERFEREGHAQASLEHPNIVPVHEAGTSDYGLFLAMRLIRGPTLRDLILGREITPKIALELLRPVAEALDTAHEAGLIHRDVKPQNILIAESRQPFLADFGLTKDESEPSLTSSGQFLGTLDYVAPEQIEGLEPRPETDVYALTAVLFQCLTGSVPYPRETNAAVLYAHMTARPPRVHEYRADLPGGLDHVIARGMAKAPQERYTTATELVLDAARVFDDLDPSVHSPPQPLQAPEQAGIRGPGPRPRGTARKARTQGTTERASVATETGATHPAVPSRGQSTALLRGRASSWLWASAAGAFLVLAAIGFGVSRLGGSGADDRKFANFASAGALELSFPSDWRRAGADVAVPGLEFRDAISLTQTKSPDRAGLTAGLVRATGPALLPDGLLDRLPRPPARDDTVRLGRLKAYRYTGVRPHGTSGSFRIFVLPTTEGIATVACTPSVSPGECDQIATTLRLTRSKPFPLGPDASYQRRLDALLANLKRDRSQARRALRSAQSSAAQARHAHSLVSAYRRAARSLSRGGVSPAAAGAHAALRRRLIDAERQYRRLAQAARKESSGPYRRIARQVTAAERAVERALRGLSALGYSIDGGSFAP